MKVYKAVMYITDNLKNPITKWTLSNTSNAASYQTKEYSK